MFESLGYKIDIFEDYSISDDFSKLVMAGGGCSNPSCEKRCVDCKEDCNQGPDPDPNPDTN